MAAQSYPPESDPVATALVEALDARVEALEEGGGVIEETDPVAGPALASHIGDTTGAHAASAISVASPLTEGNAQAELERLSLAVESGSGLPEDGTPGQVVVNTAPGEGDWGDLTAADVDALPIGGGTLTGALTLAADPTNPLHAATRQYVLAVRDALIAAAPGALDTLDELAAALGDDANFAATVTAALALKAALASPTFTGNPAAPTQAAGDNSTKLATTAYADALKSAVATLTNKRITQRVTTITSSATPTVNTDDCDCVTITALAAAITSMTTNLTGTPVNFDTLVYRIKDNGTARAITWGASFEPKGVALPTTTVISKLLTVGFIWDSVAAKWGCVSSAQEA